MKKLGFGLMRMPLTDPNNEGSVDIEHVKKMVDLFMSKGFTYFDTAIMYNGFQSQRTAKAAIVDRYPRDSFTLATKLHNDFFNSAEEREKLFNDQLEQTGAGYFDYYLLHGIEAGNLPKYEQFDCFGWLLEKKRQGLVKHAGFSFHDTPELLDEILTKHPEMEFVQLQINYLDWKSEWIQSRAVYEMAVKHGKPVIVMEPVKGGSLVNLPAEADKILRDLNGGSNASYALRFAASFPQMAVVLSGMSDMAQMTDNLSAMADFKPLNDEEIAAVKKVNDIFHSLNLVPCTACRYCVEENECPKGIRIPDMFASMNAHEAFHNWNTGYYYNSVITGGDHGKASDCLQCGKCEKVCPQHLPIRELLKNVAKTFEG